MIKDCLPKVGIKLLKISNVRIRIIPCFLTCCSSDQSLCTQFLNFNFKYSILLLHHFNYTLHKMQHLTLVLYKEYLQTCTLLCIKHYCACFIWLLYWSASIYLYFMWWIFSSTPLIRIYKKAGRASSSQLHPCNYIMIWLQFFNDK